MEWWLQAEASFSCQPSGPGHLLAQPRPPTRGLQVGAHDQLLRRGIVRVPPGLIGKYSSINRGANWLGVASPTPAVWNMIMKQCCEAATASRPVADPVRLALVPGLGGWRLNPPLIVSPWWSLLWEETIVGDLRGGVRKKGGWAVAACGRHCLGEVITAQAGRLRDTQGWQVSSATYGLWFQRS